MAQSRAHSGMSLTSRIQTGLTSAISNAHGPTSAAHAASSSGNHQQGGNKRKTFGGRGREWASKCYKLLEAMLELEDSKPFRNPVDSLKYPNYYNIVQEPMDLSKVMVKLHLGQYATLPEFGKDVHLIFDNWKMYIKDPRSQMFTQIHRLCWWFEREFKQIIDDTYKYKHDKRPRLSDTNASMSPVSDTPSCSASPTTGSSTPTGSSVQPVAPVRTNHGNTPANVNHQDKEHRPQRARGRDSGSEGTRGGQNWENVMSTMRQQLDDLSNQQNNSANQNTNIVVSIKNGTCTILQESGHNKQKGSASSSAVATHTRTFSAPAQPCSNQAANSSTTRQSPGNAATNEASTSKARNHSKQLELELRMEATNIWFGPCRSKPEKPVVLNEEGFTFYLRSPEKEVPFHIKIKDIVRCVGHLGPTKKHTLFVFISPACEKRLRDLTRENQIFGPRPKGDPCSLIAIFIHGLPRAQISKLLHIFWTMSKQSMFGQLFSEVDQKGALTLLANIKPQILERVAEKQQDADKCDKSGGPESATSRREKDDSVSSSVPGRSVSESDVLESADNPSYENPSDSLLKSPRQAINPATPQVLQRRSTASHSPSRSTSQNSESSLSTDTVNSTRNSSLTCTPLHFPLASPGLNIAQSDPVPTNPENSLTGGVPSSTPGTQVTFVQPTVNSQPGVSSSSPLQDVDNTMPITCGGIHTIVADDDDLEIIIPSDSDEEDLTITRKPGSGSTTNEVGDDIVMTATRVSIKCPITQQTMKCPMKNQLCGHAYDMDGVRQLMANRAGKAKCPVPGCQNPKALDMVDLQYDWSLRELIDAKAAPAKQQ